MYSAPRNSSKGGLVFTIHICILASWFIAMSISAQGLSFLRKLSWVLKNFIFFQVFVLCLVFVQSLARPQEGVCPNGDPYYPDANTVDANVSHTRPVKNRLRNCGTILFLQKSKVFWSTVLLTGLTVNLKVDNMNCAVEKLHLVSLFLRRLKTVLFQDINKYEQLIPTSCSF